MSDSRFFRAHTARARCLGGDFVLMGRPLVALSFAHFILLEELLGDEFYNPEPPIELLDVLAEICSEAIPRGRVVRRSEEQKQIHSLVLRQQFDEEEQRDIWNGYLAACFLSRPFTMIADGGKPADYRAPWQLIVVTFLLRHAPGYSHRELWHEMPVAEVLWRYEALREQHLGVSYLTPNGEPPPPLSEEEKARDAEIQRISDLVLRKILQKRISLSKLPPGLERDTKLKELNQEQARLLALVIQGKLNDKLEEI